ncbi:M23 family metallopeptidase [Sphingomonas cannabina]|uniref:M23 family metallopeptidase n=1 Tax=Sphingomonas cannabina TaxID=2899123 RepID=UPI001F297B2C|nr:M23 family metallopeptidase [Sphingomonas cannabina]UIJ45181.1 M23 family metallopeptidase [Sphingomonas cannabina]
MRRTAGGGGAVAALIALAGCVSPPAPAPSPAPSVAPPAANTTPRARPLPPGDFALDGAMIQGGILRGTVPTGTTALRFDGMPVPFAPDGRFLIAFDRDAGPSAALTATRSDGSVVTRALSVAPRDWQIERLNRLPRFPQPSPEFARRRPAELAQIAAARDRQTDAQGWRQQFIWPATGRISGRFGSQRIYKGEPGAYHSGVDVAKPEGAVVAAPADGVVILAADHPFTLEGNLLMIDHGMGLNSAFLHLSRIDVRVGDHVRQGQPIGRVGHTGRATGPHLHWGMKWRDARIDPLLVAGPMPAGN